MHAHVSRLVPLGRTLLSKKSPRTCGPILSIPSSPVGALSVFCLPWVPLSALFSGSRCGQRHGVARSVMPGRETQHVHSNTAQLSQCGTISSDAL
jgi:hypothetical protein